jgi:hypothetical protein
MSVRQVRLFFYFYEHIIKVYDYFSKCCNKIHSQRAVLVTLKNGTIIQQNINISQFKIAIVNS